MCFQVTLENDEFNVDDVNRICKDLVKMKNRIRASLVCKHRDRILMVQLQDPMTKVARWFPPGGKVEESETPAQAAIRETIEETGYLVRISSDRKLIAEYPYEWNGELYECVTHCFLGELDEPYREPGLVQDAAYNLGPKWFSIDEVDKLLRYNEIIRETVMKLLRA
jgi:8-oxo-dGTP pyrophosphatase MutT (NUDIX family)